MLGVRWQLVDKMRPVLLDQCSQAFELGGVAASIVSLSGFRLVPTRCQP